MKELKKLFSGKDGELSLRRILGMILVIAGIVLSFNIKPPINETILAGLVSLIGPILIAFGAFFFGIITVQNIKDITNKDKGNV